MTAKQYKARRVKVGSMRAVAKMLGVDHTTIFYRENGKKPVNREAEVALLSLPLLKNKQKKSVD